MADYIVYSSHLKPSKKKGELPDISYTFISIHSDYGWHWSLTQDRERALIFHEWQKKDAEFIADCWGMKVKELF